MLNSGGLLLAPLNSDPVSVAPASAQLVLPIALYASTAHGRATLPLTVQLQRYGRAKLPIKISLPATGKLSLPIGVQLLPPEALAETQAWSLRLLVGGVDLSDRLVGQCRVEMEEGSARVLQVQLTGPLDIPALSGQRALLDFIKNGSVIRLFTGSVELPELSLAQQLVTLSCTDDRRRMLALASRETLSGWLGGYWSPSVFSSDADSLQYAEDRLSTVAASFDLDVYGQPRLTSWQSSAQPDFTVDESLIWGSSEPTIDFSRRSEMVNSVTAEFQYRYQRLRTYRHEVSWNMGISLADYLVYEEFKSGQQYILQPKWLTPTRELFTSAAESTSWHLSAAFWKSQPPSQLIMVNLVGSLWDYSLAWINNYSAADDPCCWATKLILNHKIAQTVTETWKVKVEASDSIAKFGVMSGTVSGGNLEAQFDGSSWESDFTETESIPYAFNDWSEGVIQMQAKLKGLPAGIVDKLDVDGATRSDADEAIKTVAAVCKSKILSTHRQTFVTWKSACMPLVDVDKTGQIDIRHLQSKGKVSRVVHLFDMATGEASTETRISLFADVAVGVVEDEPLPGPVAPVVAEVIKTTAVAIATLPEQQVNLAQQQQEEFDRIWRSHGGVVISLKVKEVPLFDDEPRYTNSVAVATPEIPAAETDPVELALDYPYQVAIPFDPVTFN